MTFVLPILVICLLLTGPYAVIDLPFFLIMNVYSGFSDPENRLLTDKFFSVVVVFRPDDEYDDEEEDEDDEEEDESTKLNRQHYEDSFMRLIMVVVLVVVALVSIDALEPICELNSLTWCTAGRTCRKKLSTEEGFVAFVSSAVDFFRCWYDNAQLMTFVDDVETIGKLEFSHKMGIHTHLDL